MADSTRESDAIISSAKKSLQVNRYEGGFHRAKGRSIGRASRQVKMKNALKRAGYFGAAVLAKLARSDAALRMARAETSAQLSPTGGQFPT